jgi:drug/metabolite transporter (DMT)-like permease
MTWFLIALMAPALWAAVNYIDEYLLKKLDFSPLTLSIFSGLTGAILLIGFVLLFHPASIFIPPTLTTGLLIFAGISVFLFITFNLFALNEGEASVVSPLFLFSVIFSYIFGIIFSGEVLEAERIIGIVSILIGSCILTVEPGKKLLGKIRFKILLLMILGSFFAALDATIFRFVVEPMGETFFWTAIFWQHIGLLISAVIAIYFIHGQQKRGHFKKNKKWHSIFTRGGTAAFANIANESLATIGNAALNYSLILAPAALVISVTEGFQPFFVILYGFILANFFPKTFAKNSLRIHYKIIAVIVMSIGAVLILN